MIGLAALLMAATGVGPLSPLALADETPYSGAGCVIQHMGSNIFITDYTKGAVRVGRTLLRLQVVGGEIFNPDHGEMETPDGETAILSIARRPGRKVINSAMETEDSPVRVDFAMFDRNGNRINGASFDAVISCGA